MMIPMVDLATIPVRLVLMVNIIDTDKWMHDSLICNVQ